MLSRFSIVLLFFFPLLGQANPIQVLVSVPPLEALVQAIGGERVRVRSLVQPGENPHTYEPSPRQIASLARMSLYFSLDLPFEQALIPRIRALNPKILRVDLRAALADRLDRRLDPHLWTSPHLAAAMARVMGATLSARDPEHRGEYSRGLERLIAELDTLDRAIQAQLRELPRREFLVFHPAWGYFARRYHLTQIAIEREGKPPGPRALANLLARVRREGIRTLFVQPQFSPRFAEQIARRIDGHLVTLDPLASDYFENLRQVARRIAEAARE